MRKILIVFIMGVFAITLFLGCASNKPISQECLNYFKSLENQKYWSQQSTEAEIEDFNNGSVSPFVNESKKEWYLKFYNLDIISKDKTGSPLKATIKAAVLDTKTGKEVTYNLLVNESNEESLKNVLANSEKDEQRNNRMHNSIMAEAKKLIAEGKLDLAIQKIGDARRYKDSDEAKSLLDSLYYEQGESLYKSKNYDQAKTKLRNVLYDANLVNKAKALLSKIDAEEKAIAEAKLKNAMKSLWNKEDKFRNCTFIMHDLDPDGENLEKGKIYLFPYIGTTGIYPSSDYGSGKWYFLRLQMYFDDWIFAEKVYALVGNEVYETPVYDTLNENVTHDVWYNGVYERIDFKSSDPQVNELVRAVVNAPLGTQIKFRVEGEDYYREFTMTKEEHQAWKDILYFYDNGL